MTHAQPPRQAPKPRRRRSVQIKADELRKLREETGVGVRAFADMVGIAASTMWNLENSCRGSRTSPETAQRLARALNVKDDQIIDTGDAA